MKREFEFTLAVYWTNTKLSFYVQNYVTWLNANLTHKFLQEPFIPIFLLRLLPLLFLKFPLLCKLCTLELHFDNVLGPHVHKTGQMLIDVFHRLQIQCFYDLPVYMHNNVPWEAQFRASSLYLVIYTRFYYKYNFMISQPMDFAVTPIQIICIASC
jgi:hypothetical protein